MPNSFPRDRIVYPIFKLLIESYVIQLKKPRDHLLDFLEKTCSLGLPYMYVLLLSLKIFNFGFEGKILVPILGWSEVPK